MTYQGSNEINSLPGVTLSCISTEARDLLDDILAQCPPEIRNDTTSDRFLDWLHGSGLIQTAYTVDQLKQADREWCEGMKAMGISRQDIVYGCAYWLVRYSGMVTPV